MRVGTGYFDITGTGAALSVDGAICTAGTLTAAVTTTYPMDANFYFADDPYGGYWRVTFTVGTSSLTGLTLLLAGVVKGTPPANPITLTPTRAPEHIRAGRYHRKPDMEHVAHHARAATDNRRHDHHAGAASIDNLRQRRCRSDRRRGRGRSLPQRISNSDQGDMMIDRATKLTVVLEAQQWDAILNTLADGVYRVTAPLIAEIQQQCMKQSQVGDTAPFVRHDAPGNGDARDMTTHE